VKEGIQVRLPILDSRPARVRALAEAHSLRPVTERSGPAYLMRLVWLPPAAIAAADRHAIRAQANQSSIECDATVVRWARNSARRLLKSCGLTWMPVASFLLGERCQAL